MRDRERERKAEAKSTNQSPFGIYFKCPMSHAILFVYVDVVYIESGYRRW